MHGSPSLPPPARRPGSTHAPAAIGCRGEPERLAFEIETALELTSNMKLSVVLGAPPCSIPLLASMKSVLRKLNPGTSQESRSQRAKDRHLTARKPRRKVRSPCAMRGVRTERSE